MLLLQPDPAMLGRKGTRTTAWRGCEASCWGGGGGRWHAEVVGAALLSACVEWQAVGSAAAGSSLAQRRNSLLTSSSALSGLQAWLLSWLRTSLARATNLLITASIWASTSGLPATHSSSRHTIRPGVSTTAKSPCAAAAHVYLMLERCCIRYVSA